MIDAFKKPYSLCNCCSVLATGSQASESFLSAHSLYTQQQQRGGFTENDLDFARQPDPANIPGLLGVITTSLQVIELLLNSQEFTEESIKLVLLDHLLNPTLASEEKVQFYFQPGVWKEHGIYISNLYNKIFLCFAIASRKFCYTFNSHDLSSQKSFSEQAYKCQRLLGNYYDNMFLRDQSQDSKTQLRHLRRFFAAGLVQSFGHLLMCRQSQEIEKFADLMIHFQSIVESNKSHLSFTKYDKVSFLNLYFALQYHSDSKPLLSKELAKQFCADVTSCEDLDIPEPLLFRLILNWPFDSNASSKSTKEISQTIQRLRSFESSSFPKVWPLSNSRQQLAPLFFVRVRKEKANNDDDGGNVDIISAKKAKNFRKKFNGGFDPDKREVRFEIGKNEFLCIRPQLPKSKFRHSSEVSFSIGFTLAGPVACDVTANTHNHELARVEQGVKTVES